MKKIFVILALVGMSASVSATVIATATNNVAVTSNLGNKDKKGKKGKKGKKSCSQGESKCCSKDGEKKACCAEKSKASDQAPATPK